MLYICVGMYTYIHDTYPIICYEMAGRVRRTNAEIDNAVMTQLEKLVTQSGFGNVLVTELMANAHLEPPVFYRRYGSIDNLYDRLAQRYDFWINNTIDTSELSALGPKVFFAKTLKTLYRELCNNAVMQKLLLWEMSTNNETTRRTAQIRDLMNMNLVEYYDLLFKPAHINIRSIIALLISGVYYLILHKERAPFCKIDFDTPEGEAAFSEAVDALVEMLFDRIEVHNEKRACYERMLKDGISKKKACQYLGVDIREFDC